MSLRRVAGQHGSAISVARGRVFNRFRLSNGCFTEHQRGNGLVCTALCGFEWRLYGRRGPTRGFDDAARNLEAPDDCRASDSARLRFGQTVHPCLC
jgi:hypothetical protein